jgi:proteasome lid subunit RPN8/RPN11
MKLVLKKDLMDKMEDHALESYPMECCGFVFGKDQPDGRIITEVHTTPNSKQGDQRRRFEVDPRDYLKAERYALEKDITLLGIYHSHPDHPAVPSKHDLKQAVPFFSYLILATEKEQVKKTTSWQLYHEQFEEEEIVIENKLETLK